MQSPALLTVGKLGFHSAKSSTPTWLSIAELLHQFSLASNKGVSWYGETA
jgi:hypothetical protein